MSALREEGGFTLFELMITVSLMVVVLGATLATFNMFEETNRVNQLQNDAQQAARRGLDVLARELRNVARAPQQAQAIDRAEPYDLVYQAVDSSGVLVRRRSCLDEPRRRVLTQTQSLAGGVPALPLTLPCPLTDSAWSSPAVAAHDVVNRTPTRSRALFSYDDGTPDGVTAPADVIAIRIDVRVDVNPGARPEEVPLDTGVFLRNQNRRPVAAFSATVAGNRHVLLNGSVSQDPEEERLTYIWFDGGTEIGRGITLDYPLPAGGGRISLLVRDPAGLESRTPERLVDAS